MVLKNKAGHLLLADLQQRANSMDFDASCADNLIVQSWKTKQNKTLFSN